ncbi:B-cell differentiation antigen CD72-like [Xenopus laevis]|uniref:B-cell differentiation antigen CD72-like n=1 Tax=Xenopus laevis TaxID=8355 RepID=A0A8J1LB32_XENLA|nr:B-cell differentiation antigen CD72-like [Xenopus laevis]
MNEAVTYADLQFGNLPLKECQKAVFKGDEEEDPGATYENVESLNGPIRKVDNLVPGYRGRAQDSGGLQTQANKLLLLLILLCFGFFSAMIGIIIKYLQVSRELEETSRSHIELNSSLSWEIQSKEETLTLTHMRLSNLRTEFNQLVQLCNGTERTTREDMHRIQDLHSKTMEEKKTMEKNLTNMEALLRNVSMEYCPPEWIRFGMRCLFFSEKEDNWGNSKLNCEENMSTLLILRNNDNGLMEFISGKRVEYWVGNEIEYTRKNGYIWKTSNAIPWCWRENCAKISSGDKQSENKYNKLRWICEKKLVLLDVAYSLQYFVYISGENNKFQC